MLYALVILCLSGSALAQVRSKGGCPKVHGLTDIDMTKFTGQWYEAARYFAYFELAGKCNEVKYWPAENGSVKLVNAYTSGLNGKRVPIYVELKPHPEDPMKMTSKLPMSPFGAISDCYFLETDYKSYGVTYCCTDFGDASLKYAWIVTRDRIPDESVMIKAYEVAERNHLDRQTFLKTEQKTCNSS